MQQTSVVTKQDTKGPLSSAENAYVMKEGTNAAPHTPHGEPVTAKDGTLLADVSMNFE